MHSSHLSQTISQSLKTFANESLGWHRLTVYLTFLLTSLCYLITYLFMHELAELELQLVALGCRPAPCQEPTRIGHRTSWIKLLLLLKETKKRRATTA
jgi:hypothetical protein